MRKRRPVLLLAAAALLLRLAGAVEIDPQLYLDDIKYLASEKLKGRLAGTRELNQAARYIAEQFRSMGLRPAGDGGYFQRFRVTTHARAGKSNRLAYSSGKTRTSLEMDRDFCPSSMSSNGVVSGPVVFAGYGITAREYGYDDYAGIDVKGKIVLVLRHEPQEFEDNSVFGGRVYTNHAQIESKAINAKRHGASALILAADTATHRGSFDQLNNLGPALGPDSAGIPFVEVKADVADRWLALAGRSIEGEIQAIDGDLRGRSFALPASLTLDLSVDLRRNTRPVENVLAYLPGSSDEYLILGAHYDHVGLGEQYSMEPSKRGKVHPGADDNASGTSGVLELARWFSKHPGRRRGILFVAFGGEEFGLLGSNHYVEAPRMPLAKAIAMINLDMIGRVRNNQVFVGGVDTSANFRALVESLNRSEEANFDLEDTDTGGYGSSDHYSFTPEGIPFLFFFSGLHPDYHTPGDTWDRVDAPQAARLLRLVGRVIERLLDSPDRPAFQRKAS